MQVTAELLRQFFSYDPETGNLTWLVNRNSRVKAGDIAGSIEQQGYVVISFQNRNYKAHRLIWLLVTGSWPKGQIDHINHRRADNRWVNLRDVPQRVNTLKRVKAITNTSGRTGIYPAKSGNWIARIYVMGKHINLGTFSCFDDAVKAREEAEQMYGFETN